MVDGRSRQPKTLCTKTLDQLAQKCAVVGDSCTAVSGLLFTGRRLLHKQTFSTVPLGWCHGSVEASHLIGYSHVSSYPGGWFNKNMSSYQHRKFHCGDKTVVRSSYLHNGISYTGKMVSFLWNQPPGYRAKIWHYLWVSLAKASDTKSTSSCHSNHLQMFKTIFGKGTRLWFNREITGNITIPLSFLVNWVCWNLFLTSWAK